VNKLTVLKAIARQSQDLIYEKGMTVFVQFSQPADNNKGHIRDQFIQLFPDPTRILEIGSGSGQHAVFMAKTLPWLTWQPTDRGDYFPGLVNNIERLGPDNIKTPHYLDISSTGWPDTDHIYLANVLHIMPAALLTPLFQGAAAVLADTGKLCIYGPFKYDGEFTTASNASFDEWLKARDPLSGIRDIETLQQLAADQGLSLAQDNPMPANNQFLVFER
jgi:SAM-dependent methyltransferase